jgi:hypothetical protein
MTSTEKRCVDSYEWRDTHCYKFGSTVAHTGDSFVQREEEGVYKREQELYAVFSGLIL